MSFSDAVRSVYRNYATFNGRAPRSEYWWFQLFYLLVIIGIYVAGVALAVITRGYSTASWIVLIALSVFVLGSLVPALAVTVRRLHDSDKSGWWLLLVFVPYVGAFVIFIFTVMDSSVGFNRYGPPYGEQPGDAHVQYYGSSREEAWARFVGDAADAAAAGYQ